MRRLPFNIIFYESLFDLLFWDPHGIDPKIDGITISENPIHNWREDRYDFSPVAHSISKTILKIKAPNGEVLALTGKWGSGKSSCINIVKEDLKDKNLIISEFNCLWFKDDDNLAFSFLQNIITITKRFSLPAATELKHLAFQLSSLPSDSTVTKEIPYIGVIARLFKEFNSNDRTIEETFRKIKNELSKKDKKIIIIIDDIDRLVGKEIISLFKTIKFLGQLPNVIYLISYDSQIIQRVFRETYKEEGDIFLDKIIQLTFNMPSISSSDILQELYPDLMRTCGIEDIDLKDFLSVFYNIVTPAIKTPRSIKRLKNTIKIQWTNINKEINPTDFIALETIRLFNPEIINQIYLNRENLCNLGSIAGADPIQTIMENAQKIHSSISQEHLKYFLNYLFPETNLKEHLRSLDERRKVRILKHLQTYFHYHPIGDNLSKKEIQILLDNISDTAYIKQLFTEHLNNAHILLEEIIVHKNKINNNLDLVLYNILIILDIINQLEINLYDRSDEKIFFLFRDLFKKLSSQKSFNEHKFIELIDKAPLSCVVALLYTAWLDHQSKRKASFIPEESRLFSLSFLKNLNEKVKVRIQKSIEDSSILDNPQCYTTLNLFTILNQDSLEKIKEWLMPKLKDPIIFLNFIKTIPISIETSTLNGQNRHFKRLPKSETSLFSESEFHKTFDFLKRKHKDNKEIINSLLLINQEFYKEDF